MHILFNIVTRDQLVVSIAEEFDVGLFEGTLTHCKSKGDALYEKTYSRNLLDDLKSANIEI
jgi:hypothetical protein